MPTMTADQAAGSNAKDGYLIVNGDPDDEVVTFVTTDELEDVHVKTKI
jgi:hypothetical protein